VAFADTARLVASLELQDKFSKPASDAERRLAGLESSLNRLGSTSRNAFSTGLGFLGAQVVARGVSTVFGSIKDAAINMNASLETSTLQFETLIGNADEAQQHVRDLFTFAARTPFETAPIIEASRIMRTFGGAALDTQENLTNFGNAAAATSAPIEEVAFWSSRLYAALQAGRPFGEAAQRLGELGILTPQVRNELEDLQDEGANGNQIWARYRQELGRFDGAMEKQAGTWRGLTSSIKDNISILGATTFKPIFDTAKAGMEDLLAFLSTPQATAAAEDFARRIASVINPENLRAFVDTLREAGEQYLPKIQAIIETIPWNEIKEAGSYFGTGIRTAFDLLSNLPPQAQSLILALGGLNKLTGGAVTGVLSIALSRGTTPLTPMYTKEVGLGTGVPGGSGVGPPTVLGQVGTIAGQAGIFAAIAGGILALQDIASGTEQGRDEGFAALLGGFPSLIATAIEEAIGDPLGDLLGANEDTRGAIEQQTGDVSRIDQNRAREANRLQEAQRTLQAKTDKVSGHLRDVRDANQVANSLLRDISRKDFSPKIEVKATITSNVSITDITRRLVSTGISVGGHVTADAP
jgi:hypothetical protein